MKEKIRKILSMIKKYIIPIVFLCFFLVIIGIVATYEPKQKGKEVSQATGDAAKSADYKKDNTDAERIAELEKKITEMGKNQDIKNILGEAIPASQALKTAFYQDSQNSAIADIAELSCFPTNRYDCSAEGCTPVAPASYYFVDYGTENGTYFRCDAKGCDPYAVEVVHSGIYTQFIPSGGQAMLFKVASDDLLLSKGEFIDIATLGTQAIVSFGKCN